MSYAYVVCYSVKYAGWCVFQDTEAPDLVHVSTFDTFDEAIKEATRLQRGTVH